MLVSYCYRRVNYTLGDPMKNLFIVLFAVASFNVFASNEKTAAYPQLNVWPNRVEVRIWNNSDKDIQCSGSIFIYTQSNRFRSEFFNRIVGKHSQVYQNFNNYYYNDPYRNAHHSIYCREIY